MLTPAVYQARLKQEENLIQRYEEALSKQEHDQTSAQSNFQEKLQSVHHEKLLLDQRFKLLKIRVEFLKIYLHLFECYAPTDLDAPLRNEFGTIKLCRDGTELTFRVLIRKHIETYQDRLNQRKTIIMEGYEELLKGRITDYINGFFVTSDLSKSLMAKEMERFEKQLNDVVLEYQLLVFPDNQDLVEISLAEAQAIFLEMKEKYEDCLEQLPVMENENNVFQEDKTQTIEALRRQYRSIFPGFFTKVIYEWCGKGNVEGLAKHLKNQEGADHENYLRANAPEALHRACAMGQLQIVTLLLLYDFQDLPDRYGYTPMHYAVLSVHKATIAVLEVLYQQGHRIDSLGPKKQTLLHTASACGNVQAVKWLIKKGLHLNQPDAEGNTPLHCAVFWNRVEMVRLLLSENAILSYNKLQLTPLALAVCAKDPGVLEIFQQKNYFLCALDQYSLAQQRLSPMSLVMARPLLPPGQKIPFISNQVIKMPEDDSYVSPVFEPLKHRQPSRPWPVPLSFSWPRHFKFTFHQREPLVEERYQDGIELRGSTKTIRKN